MRCKMLILIYICLFMTGVTVIIAVCSYRTSKKELDAFKHSDFSKVFATKLCDHDTTNCDVKYFQSHCSFEELVTDYSHTL